MLSMKERLRNMKELMRRNDDRMQAMSVKRCKNDRPYYILELCKGKPDMGNGKYTRFEEPEYALRSAEWEWNNRIRFFTLWDHVTIYKCVRDQSDAVCWADGVTIGNGL